MDEYLITKDEDLIRKIEGRLNASGYCETDDEKIYRIGNDLCFLSRINDVLKRELKRFGHVRFRIVTSSKVVMREGGCKTLDIITPHHIYERWESVVDCSDYRENILVEYNDIFAETQLLNVNVLILKNYEFFRQYGRFTLTS